jgi:hypothetical protein
VLLNELFLQEDNAEMRDLMAVAYYLSRWFASPKYDGLAKKYSLTIKEIEKIFGEPAPKIQTKSVNWLLFKEFPGESYEPLRFIANHPNLVGKHDFGGYTPPPHYIVAINTDLLTKRGKTTASTLLHELDHALIDLKSRGQAMGNYATPTDKDSYKVYLQHPMEVNARFAQSLWDLAVRYDKISKDNLLPTIKNVFNANQINQEVITDPKKYKRLIVRSYKFLDDVGQIIDIKKTDKPTFVQRVKNLIRKWLPQ